MKNLQHLRVGLVACALAWCVPCAYALEGRVVANGFDEPLYVTAPKGDGRLFVVEKGGVIRVIKNGNTTKFLDISARVGTAGERGLLGLAFDPDYATNGRFYIDFTSASTGATKVERYTVTPPTANKADPSTRQDIITINQPTHDNHKGGWIGFRPGDKKNLYISTGDGGSSYDPDNNSQNGQVLLGKMLRIDVSGTGSGYKIPSDNPFVNSSSVKDEIWALGLRNAFRASFDRKTGAFWMGDVGQDTREEIDFERAGDPGGHNYGWRLREGKIKTPGGVGGDKPGLTNPVFDYPHLGNQGSLGNCVTGGYVYRGPSIPDADGRYFFGDCVSDRAFSMTFNADGTPIERREETSALLGGSGLSVLASFGEDGRGRLYVVGLSGTILAMCPSSQGQAKPPVPAAVPGQVQVLADLANPCAAQ
ncbi:MAG TPA: PQQ-dependent sugar dehydrogenase [Ideonella sp.]|uniref:PQQ-dependent sugar dehydrogenase n=1 Tax=Ideonella sp. TaxID=1929293 RepID=UPI002E32ACE2|nr:PQQ-dependent sugar dehydrogenase [Ideonella sp.]HEX5686820.1 PQQ-dependent sugar dehydrogenase [Ideonella sp.]